MYALILAAGYDLNGLWKIVERSIVWQTIRHLSNSVGVGVMVILTVLLFAWKGYGWVRRNAKSKTRA